MLVPHWNLQIARVKKQASFTTISSKKVESLGSTIPSRITVEQLETQIKEMYQGRDSWIASTQTMTDNGEDWLKVEKQYVDKGYEVSLLTVN